MVIPLDNWTIGQLDNYTMIPARHDEILVAVKNRLNNAVLYYNQYCTMFCSSSKTVVEQKKQGSQIQQGGAIRREVTFKNTAE